MRLDWRYNVIDTTFVTFSTAAFRVTVINCNVTLIAYLFSSRYALIV